MQKILILMVAAFVLVGCANTETQRCRKHDGVTSCESESEPRVRPDRHPGI